MLLHRGMYFVPFQTAQSDVFRLQFRSILSLRHELFYELAIPKMSYRELCFKRQKEREDLRGF